MKKRKEKLACKVNPQTLWNLYKLADIAGYGDNLGRVVDKLVREKMLSLREWDDKT